MIRTMPPLVKPVVVKSKIILIVLSILIVEKGKANKTDHPVPPSTEERNRYIKEAQAVFSEIDRLQASTEVGITYMDYMKRVGELIKSLELFLIKTKPPMNNTDHFPYFVIAKNIMYHKYCVELWRISIDVSGDVDVAPIVKPFLGKVWGFLAAQTILGKAIFNEPSPDKRREIAEQSNRNEQIIEAEI